MSYAESRGRHGDNPAHGVESVACIGTLQALSIQEAFHLAAPIDAAAGAALAANPCVERVDFHTSAQPFSQESLLALSHSQSLEHVACLARAVCPVGPLQHDRARIGPSGLPNGLPRPDVHFDNAGGFRRKGF
jgi:hypothetical protein